MSETENSVLNELSRKYDDLCRMAHFDKHIVAVPLKDWLDYRKEVVRRYLTCALNENEKNHCLALVNACNDNISKLLCLTKFEVKPLAYKQPVYERFCREMAKLDADQTILSLTKPDINE